MAFRTKIGPKLDVSNWQQAANGIWLCKGCLWRVPTCQKITYARQGNYLCGHCGGPAQHFWWMFQDMPRRYWRFSRSTWISEYSTYIFDVHGYAQTAALCNKPELDGE